jgi:hypothetical protein
VINVFIGYDSREAVAFSVLSHSIHVRSSLPVSITPIMLSQLNGLMWRERNELQSTDFSFSRFLVPYLSGYQGWSIFMDCDMLVLDDLVKLWEMRDDKYAVMCVKHDHQPKEDIKFLNAVQTKYQKKNWSSVMLINNQKCSALTPEYVNKASGLDLHQFKWLEGDHLIGEIPARWNHLVGYDGVLSDAGIVHFTLGGPYFTEWHDCDFSQEWRSECAAMLKCDQKIDSEQVA